MKRMYGFALLSLIVAVSAVLRLYALGSIPHGFAWDEAAIGYNGFAIVKTRRDEWLERLPVSFRSFGDYKAPLAIYINGVSTFIFGLSPLAVRLPFALAGIGSVILFALVVFELWRSEVGQTSAYLLSALFISTTPWHLHYSRVAFESGLSLFFLLLSVFAFLRFVLDQRIARQLLWISVSSLSASLALYTYHSAKLTVPILFIGLAILYMDRVRKRAWGIGLGASIAILCLFPLLRDAVQGQGLTRANVTVFSQTDSTFSAVVTSVQHFFAHIHHQFLVLGQVTSLRHGDGVWGVLLPTTYVLVLLCLGSIAVRLFSMHSLAPEFTRENTSRRLLVALLWIAAGIAPAAIGTEVPHSNRALLALPGFLLLAVEGTVMLWHASGKLGINQQIVGSHGEKNLVPKLVVGAIVMAHLLVSVAYIHRYFYRYSADSTTAFSDGYIEAFQIASEYEKGKNGKPEVETIIFSDSYGQPYIYALFVRKTDPIWYQGGSLIKYQFSKVKPSDLLRENALVVATPQEELPNVQADHLIYGADGSIRFMLYKTPK